MDLRTVYINCTSTTKFNPSLVDIQVFDRREGEYYNVTLSELTEEDITDICSGDFEIVENEDMYERFIDWRSGAIEQRTEEENL